MSTGALGQTTDGVRTALSRVTLVGERRRVDLVLPSREPVGLLLPEVMRLLDDRVGGRPELRHLVTADGSALAHDSTLESAGVPDGAVLRLVRAEDAPSAPVVHDVTDETAEDLDARGWRWRPAARRVTAGAATVGWAVAAGVFARGAYETGVVAGVLLAVALVAASAGALLGRAGKRGLATASIATAGALGLLGASTLADAQGWSGTARVAAIAAAGVVALVLLGLFTPLGRGGLVGAGALAATVVCWLGVAALVSGPSPVDEQARVGAVLAVVSVIVLGLLPRLALMASGLSGLDDRRSGGASVSRYQVAAALTATHRGLALATVTMAVSAAVAGVFALRAPTQWTVVLAVVTMVVLALRARAFPLVAEVVVLLGAAALLAVRLVSVWQEHSGDAAGPLAALVLLAVLPLLVLAVQPAEHVRVRLRRLGDTLESIGVITLFPLLIGVFGVYGRLLDTFA
ncbi:type VII secretion integral membrane protein EccD [Streptomyces ipomoeae]|uniref:Type VII secretion integral membrane protein EccD n=1 Tax=Streptomyces ipomoeae TaxID=103232 RepID=A0AAE9AVS8_9ACTN|nr:type VII secretion integral membrane protein EccD [Streptomyces ipomoeae]MDX2700652.1 type VII secretion integral membrane protein EccD [Streptomyces ipomoeae]MDX2846323.1 type VII secretion integral membrane protein EccD [Streptomyces ipomoeae]TQE17653.1 type VII secretion integral membrane protein EccD [Streptomyces ipomoeae]TQE18579.1 type VII secretion integral membrane protein EccD [Streptomyces ipomoeae]